MSKLVYRLIAFASASLLLPGATTVHAAVTRVSGPTTLLVDGRALVKFDAAYDSKNRVTLVAYGTQAAGPVNGILLNENGVAITNLFALSDGAQQSGWARVIYSPEQSRFIVSYVRIMAVSNHQKVARFVTVSNNAPVLGPEMILDWWQGDSGTATGIAYAAMSGKFLVTFSHYLGSFSASFVSVVDPSGTFSAPIVVSNTGDGESDPEIACDPGTRRCLVVGSAWGVLDGSGKSSFWARYIDDATGAPLGNVGYIMRVGGLMDPAGIVYTPTPGQFLIAMNFGGIIKGIVANGAGTIGAPFNMIQDTTNTQGVGYGFPGLRYNPATQTTFASLTTWTGNGAVAELTSSGARVPGGFDMIPDTPEVPSKPYDSANQFTVVAPNTNTSGLIALEDHYFKAIHVSVYTGSASKRRVHADLDGDGSSDFLVWNTSTGMWHWTSSSGSAGTAGISGIQWGNRSLGDSTFINDMDGDGIGDMVVYRASTGVWYWLTSSSGYSYAAGIARQWGDPNQGDVPLVADFDGDGKGDLVIWRPSYGGWFVLTSSSGYDYSKPIVFQWGNQSLGDRPFVGDFDGDGKADPVIWRASTGTWFWLISSAGYSTSAVGIVQWGNASLGDVPMVADFDGDGRADIAVWRASTGTWFWLISSSGYSYSAAGIVQWGNASLGDVPLADDFDGDGKADLAIWRAGTWYWLPSSSGYSYAASRLQAIGTSSDVPIGR